MSAIRPFVLIIFSLIFSSFVHEYYVSVTQIEYISEEKSLQIITRIDFDDLERTLQERYNSNIDLTTLNEKPLVQKYIEKYLKDKLLIKVNTQNVNFEYIGRKYDNDQVICYLEATQIDSVTTIEVKNTVLFDNFPEQKNVLKILNENERFSLICTKNNPTEFLNF